MDSGHCGVSRHFIGCFELACIQHTWRHDGKGTEALAAHFNLTHRFARDIDWRGWSASRTMNRIWQLVVVAFWLGTALVQASQARLRPDLPSSDIAVVLNGGALGTSGQAPTFTKQHSECTNVRPISQSCAEIADLGCGSPRQKRFERAVVQASIFLNSDLSRVSLGRAPPLNFSR